MKKKLLSIFLATLMLGSIVVGCTSKDSDQGSSSDSQNSSTTSEAPADKEYVDVTDGEQHLVDDSKRTHINNNDYSKMLPFVVDGQSDYVIINGATAAERANWESTAEPADAILAAKAIEHMRKQIGAATGYYPEVIKDADHNKIIDNNDPTAVDTPLPAKKYIVLSHPVLEAEYGVEWDNTVDLDYSGYMIKTVGDHVFMKVNSHYGYQTVCLAFLREVIGYEWYSEDTIVYTKDGAKMPTFDLVEKPDFDLVWRSGFISENGKTGSGVTNTRTFTYINGNFVHNSFDYLPYEQYGESNRKWYADKATQLVHGGTGIGQLCYSAHGDKEEYDLMLQTAFEGCVNTLIEQPNVAALTFTREDHNGHCDCDTCQAVEQEFNGSHAVLYMFFVNDLDTLIQEWIAENQPGRDVTVLFFAYSQTASAPVFGEDGDYSVPTAHVAENEDGVKYNYVIDQEGNEIELPYNQTYETGLKCNNNVGVFFAPIDAAFTESFYHSVNKKHKETFEKWGLLTERLYCWIYDTMFTDYLTPYNSFDAIPETIRFLKDAGGQFLFNQAQGENTVCTGFGAVKTYLNYELPRDVNQDTGVMMDKFFANYFREAAGPMREYYELLVAYMEQLQEKYPNIFYTGRRQNTDLPQYWDFETLLGWLELCDEAKLAVAKYKTTDPDLYQTLIKHITIETIFPRWMICQYYGGYYNPTELQKMRETFANDCTLLSIPNYAEGANEKMSNYFASWGVVIDPDYKLA